MLFLHFQAAGVDGLADLAVVSLDMNEFVLLGDRLCRLLVQAGLFLGIHLLLEETAGKFLRLFRKTDPLGLLAEEHLRVSCERALRHEKFVLKFRVLAFELRVFSSELCDLGFQGLHPFLFFGCHFPSFFLITRYEKTATHASLRPFFFDLFYWFSESFLLCP